MVLVHGSLDRATSFSRVMRRLEDLHVLAYDRRGYHRSRDVRPVATSLGEHVADLLELVDGRRCVVIGHSYGGDVAIGAAIESPESVVGLAAYEPPLPWLEWWPRHGGRSALEGMDPSDFAEGFFRRMVGDESWERMAEGDRDERRADGPALLAELAAIRDTRPQFDPNEIRVPAVFGRGSRSVPHHLRSAETLAGAAPRGELFEISGAAHGAHLTHPEAFAAMVRRVLDRVGSG